MPYQIRGFSVGTTATMTSCTRYTSDRSGSSTFAILSTTWARFLSSFDPILMSSRQPMLRISR